MSWREFHKPVIHGASCGALIWLAYAEIEYLLCTVVPLRFDGFTIPLSHWAWTTIVFSSYAVVGALSGSLAAGGFVLFRRRKVIAPEIATIAAVAFAALYSAWLIAAGLWRGTGFAGILLSGIFLLAGAWSIRRSNVRWQGIIGFPWTAPAALLVPFKLCDYARLHSPAAIWATFMVWAVVIAASALFLTRFPRALTRPDSSVLFRRAALLCGSTAVLFVSTLALARTLPPYPSEPAAAAANRPNIVLVIWDTARADHASVYGYQRDTTPFLRTFAEHATLYQSAFSASDMTLSSSASLFTGLYASWHGAHFSRQAPYGRPLDPKFQTVAEALRVEGYTTIAVLANCSYLSPTYRLDQGFQLYDVRTPVNSDAIDRRYYLRAALQKLLAGVLPTGELDRRFRSGDAITQDAVKLLAGHRHAPMFLTLNYMDAHLPYIPPRPFDTLYPGKDASLTFADLELLRKEVLQTRRTPTRHESAHLVSQYDGGIAFLDSQFKRLVAELKRLGLYDSTMIVLTADHGEALGNRNLLEHAVSVYQDQVHVPLIVKYPGQTEPSVVSTPVSAIDILPTVLDVAGAPPARQTQGRSLRQPDASRVVMSESFRSGLLTSWSPRFDRVQRSIVHGSMKLIQSTTGQSELYDLAADPAESTNLFRNGDPSVSHLSQSLAAIVANAPSESAPARPLDKQNMDRLRSLGYVQ